MINPVVYSISLDVHKIGSQKVLSMVRFDTKRTVVASLTENGRPYTITDGCTAVFTAKKPDGTVIYNDCRIDYVNNTIVYPVTAQTTAVNGRVDCQLRLIGREGNIISSPTFTIVVADTLFNEGRAVDSSDEFNKLTAYIAELEARAAAGEFDGKSIYIKGAVSSAEELNDKVSTAEAGDSYLTSDGHLHVFDGTSFVDTGRLQGERGVSGVHVGSDNPPEDCNVRINPDGDCVTIDQELNPNSSNPIANKAVAPYLLNTVDYVVEEGVAYCDLVNSSFQYRKWNSGLLEVYGKFWFYSDFSTQIGCLWRAGSTVTLTLKDGVGENLFHSDPQTCVCTTNLLGYFASARCSQSGDKTVAVSVCSAEQFEGMQSVLVSVQILGMWK